MRIEQRAAVPAEDRGPLLDLWIAAWRAALPLIDFGADRAWLSDHLDRLLQDGAVLLAMRETTGAVCGFLTIHRDTGTIDQLAVDPACSGQGLGRHLMDEAKRLSPAGLRLRVAQINRRAVRFYAAAGFVVTGEAVSERSSLAVFTMAWPGSVL